MKISRELPQFQKETVLFMVTGKQEAKFYLVTGKTIKEVESFRIKKPRYSDKEGWFKRRVKGLVLGSGSVTEPKKEKVIKDFLRELEKNLKDFLARNKVDKIYIFSPHYILNQVKAVLPSSAKEKIVMTLDGEYFSEHPFVLLEKIKKRQVEKKKPQKEEARKLWNKFKQASYVIKGKPPEE